MKRRQKADLPEKMCPVCLRPFKWRKKWEKNWENVKYCSKKCSGLSRRQKDVGED